MVYRQPTVYARHEPTNDSAAMQYLTFTPASLFTNPSPIAAIATSPSTASATDWFGFSQLQDVSGAQLQRNFQHPRHKFQISEARVMDRAKTDELKQAIVNRARELGMDPTQRHTCSPGIKALAQMHEVLVLQPHLLQTFAGDLLVHDFGLLSSPMHLHDLSGPSDQAEQTCSIRNPEATLNSFSTCKPNLAAWPTHSTRKT